MAADNPTLKACLHTADSIESALNLLGDTSQWPAGRSLGQDCARFRQACRELAGQKGLHQFAIAFIGPKNAGKTTFLTMLLRNSALRERLAAGEGLAASTERILWLTSQPITDVNRQVEEILHVDSSDLVNLGCDYTLIDVPGADEANRERAQAAEHALRAAHLKVLVVEARTMEDANLIHYVEHADGATLLPVINQVRPDTDEGDIRAFLTRLKEALPASTILTPLRVPDFQLADGDEAARREQTANELHKRLREVIRTERLDELLEPQLLGLQARFQKEMHQALVQALPATANATRHLQEIESGLAVQALERLLGADDRDRAVLTGLRQQLRAVFQQRTPVLFFPWRTFVSLANLLYGALEKMPLLLAGSLPSLVSSAMTAVKNVARDREFHANRREGLRTHAELLVKESLYPGVDHLESAICSDLRRDPQSRASGHDGLEVEFEGLELLQTRSSELFQEVLDSRAPGRFAAYFTGLVGLGIFWGIFIWPFISLYRDYFEAVRDFVSEPVKHTIFPTESFSMIGTSFLLSVFPMLFWLLIILSWVGSRGRALDCLQSLRQGHQAIIEDLNARHLLRVRARHPHLEACLRLFSQASRQPESSKRTQESSFPVLR